MIYEDALSAVRRYVAEAFKTGTATFPHYTLHGAEHLEELDRLALLIGEFIPSLPKDRLNLLRLALILHDFAMVEVPDPAREAELRRQMGPDLTFADIVRKTHQDEIERSFTKPGRIALLQGLIPTAGAQILEDACTIARHHRFHALDRSPEHVRDICALMRILDELDIGPKRAPLPTYEALRSQMDDNARFHWLKHLCTRAVDRYATFSAEERNQRKILKVFVAVKATELTWKPIQEKVLAKLRECLEQEGVNDVLRSTLRVEFDLSPAPEPDLSGVSQTSRRLRDEEIDAYRKATDADPKNSQAWYKLGVRLGQQADREEDSQASRRLRDEQIDAYRKATDADPKNSRAWNNLGVALGQQADREEDPQVRQELRLEFLAAAQKAADLGGRRYNLACALALVERADEALSELQGCLDRGEISVEHVKQDRDWDSLRETSRFQEILQMAGTSKSR